MAEKLKIMSLGGLGEIGKNLTVLEYGRDIIIVDCGLGFPDEDMYGVDLVIPDVTYLVKNQQKIRGIFLTHGHEDHIGSLPYVLRQINAPIHGTRLTLGLVKLKLEEHKLLNQVKLIDHEAGDIVKTNNFSVEFIHVNHSIADAVAFAIKTPIGTVVMTGDFKIDATAPGGIMDLGRLGQLGKEGVLALLCDSTNAEKAGFTAGEQTVSLSFDRLFNCDKRIIVTTFASNAYRLQNLLNMAHKHGRKIAFTGRSMENILKVSTELGYMKVPPKTLIDIKQIKSVPKEKLVIVSTGSQGEDMSAMYRMAFNTHRQVEIEAGDRVVISASPIPGNEKSIGKIINELSRKGAELIYDKSDAVHVSGHACQEELKIIHGLLQPKFFIPVHGEIRHLMAHSRLAQSMGMNPRNIVISEIGRTIELTAKSCKLGNTVPAGRVLVDGTGVGDVGSVVLRDRKHLAQDGMVVIVVNISSQDGAILTGPDIITRGFIYVKESGDLMDELKNVANNTIERCQCGSAREWNAMKTALRSDISAYLYKNTKRNPMILPVIMEV